jgi:hypothetical protein
MKYSLQISEPLNWFNFTAAILAEPGFSTDRLRTLGTFTKSIGNAFIQRLFLVIGFTGGQQGDNQAQWTRKESENKPDNR